MTEKMKSLVTLLIMCSLTGYAQDTVRTSPRFMNGGFGAFATTNSIEGLTYSLAYSKIDKNKMTRYRFALYSEMNLFGPSPSENYYSFSYMIGKSAGKKVKPYASIGPGVMFGVHRGNYKYSSGGFFSTDHYSKEPFITPVASIETGLMIIPFESLGFGFNLYSDCSWSDQTLGGTFMIVYGNF